MDAAAAQPILDYSFRPDVASDRRHGWPVRLVLLACSLAALVVPFLRFAGDVSPLDGARAFSPSRYDAVSHLGLSFFIAIPIVVWKARRWMGPARRLERWLFWPLAALAWLPHARVLFDLTSGIIRDHSVSGNGIAVVLGGLMLICGVGMLALGVLLIVVLVRGGNADAAIEVALVTPYLASAMLCLVGFAADAQAGYLLALPVTVVWWADEVWMAWPYLRRGGTRWEPRASAGAA